MILTVGLFEGRTTTRPYTAGFDFACVAIEHDSMDGYDKAILEKLPPERVSRFARNTEWHAYSNFSPISVFWHGQFVPTSEHAYQSAKATSGASRNLILTADGPRIAQSLGRRIACVEDWNDMRIDVMREVLVQKFFNTDPRRVNLLLRSGRAELVEGTTGWHDNFFGNCECGRPSCLEPGENNLGKLLMELRDEAWVQRQAHQRILVTGSRKWTNEDVIREALIAQAALDPRPPSLIVGKNPSGVDNIAERVARELGWNIEEYPVRWKPRGSLENRWMPNRRNTEMVWSRPHVTLAFRLDDSRGTSDCIEKSMHVRIPTAIWEMDGTLLSKAVNPLPLQINDHYWMQRAEQAPAFIIPISKPISKRESKHNMQLDISIGTVQSTSRGPNAVYVGRANPRARLSGSPLANPYKADFKSIESIEQAVEQYRLWIQRETGPERTNDKVVNELDKLALQALTEPITLVCWQHQGSCHAEVIREYVIERAIELDLENDLKLEQDVTPASTPAPISNTEQRAPLKVDPNWHRYYAELLTSYADSEVERTLSHMASTVIGSEQLAAATGQVRAIPQGLIELRAVLTGSSVPRPIDVDKPGISERTKSILCERYRRGFEMHRSTVTPILDKLIELTTQPAPHDDKSLTQARKLQADLSNACPVPSRDIGHELDKTAERLQPLIGLSTNITTIEANIANSAMAVSMDMAQQRRAPRRAQHELDFM